MSRVFICLFLTFFYHASAGAANSFNTDDITTTLSGKLSSGSGVLPDGIKVIAYGIDGNQTNGFSGEVAGEIQGDHFQIKLSAGKYLIGAKAPNWKTIGHFVVTPTINSTLDLVLFPEIGSNEKLMKELETMEAADQEARMRMIQSNDPANIRAMSEIDARNQLRLKEIIRDFGWPTATQVGLKGVSAVWLMIQHSPHDFIKEYLPNMKVSAERSEIPWSSVALSIDRDLVYDGKKQLYGSQAKIENGKVELDPVEDETHLDERRLQFGMESIEEYKKELLKMYTPKPEEK